MRTNDSTTRTAQVYAFTLAIGDVLTNNHGEYLGVIASVPELETMTVAFELDEGGLRVVRRSYPKSKLVRIEIARRTS